jgi:hypothetical protein
MSTETHKTPSASQRCDGDRPSRIPDTEVAASE